MQSLGQAAMRYSLAPSRDCEKLLQLAVEELLDDLPANDLPVLVSHENAAGAPPGKGGETRLYPMMPRIAAKIAEWAHEYDTSFVFYSRNMNAWRSSLWAQVVRSEGYSRGLDDFIAETTELPGWGDLRKRMGRAVGAERVLRLRLEDEAAYARPGTQLLRHAGLTDEAISAMPELSGSSNERLRPAATEFIRQVNGLSLNPHARRKVADLVAQAQHLFTAETPSEGAL
ncbi:hypothetical protein PAF17_13420 [Paracoccus sp. Z330]|uniref:Sulfotransferase family protein n=1 Tax=Paracoccus onchidii TaxID=3017813 RepID=A0ABT4ZGR3_9RHOB|nr:hypothetical protein [Paracoccus onchidii]MDB6178497.1 hypothetical protein [Paracoccus onchidii]